MDDDETVFGTDFGLDSDEETKADEKLKRTFQSEQDFLVQKRSWTPKLENKEELLKMVPLLNPPKTKFDTASLKSAAEYLYYMRDYTGALDVGERVLKVAGDEETYLGAVERGEVEMLVERCRRRLGKSG